MADFGLSKMEDNLRSAIHESLVKLGRIRAERPDATFLEEFLSNGYFFLHAVKCWSRPKYPGFGRSREERKQLGVPLLHACAATHLKPELKKYSPQKVCALGELPYLALCHILKDSALTPTLASPTEGKVFEAQTYRLPWPLLYTVFPQSQSIMVRGRQVRVVAKDLHQRHLSTYLV